MEERAVEARSPTCGEWLGHLGRLIVRAHDPARNNDRIALFGRLFGSLYLVFLCYPVFGLLRAHPTSRPLLLAGMAGLVAFAALYLWLVLRNPFRSLDASTPEHRARRAGFAALVALSLVLNLAYGEDGYFLGLFIYAGAVVGMGLPARGAIQVIGVLTVLTVAVGWIVGADLVTTGGIAFQVVVSGFILVGYTHLVVTIRELRSAREEIARLAVSEERLRFARDLHDLLGHSLSLITLKSELAGRLLPDAPEKAAAEVRDIEGVAREALREVREAVAGYRQPTLTAELSGAREILTAAGISCRCVDDTPILPPAAEAVLAWTVREGVTNVIRHSQARRCEIHITRSADEIGIEVTDDGRSDVSAPVPSATVSPGSGLSGLAERVAAQGGSFEAGPRPEGGFRLRVMLPVGEDTGVEPAAPLGAGVGGADWERSR